MKRRFSGIITVIIIIMIITGSLILINSKKQDTSSEIAKCIGENSVLYVQLGCHACETQENLFGESYQYLNVVDCFYERERCGEIQVTPTWKINGELYTGVQQIEKLKELTGC